MSGLWRRGAVYQYRVRIPTISRQVLGGVKSTGRCSTTCFPDAVRIVRKVAFEIESYFLEELRGARSATALPGLVASNRASNSILSSGPNLPRHRAQHQQTLASERFVIFSLVTDNLARTKKSALIYRTTYAAIVESSALKRPSLDQSCDMQRNIRCSTAASSKCQKTLSQKEPAGDRGCRASAGIPSMSAANANEYMNKLSGLFSTGPARRNS